MSILKMYYLHLGKSPSSIWEMDSLTRQIPVKIGTWAREGGPHELIHLRELYIEIGKYNYHHPFLFLQLRGDILKVQEAHLKNQACDCAQYVCFHSTL